MNLRRASLISVPYLWLLGMFLVPFLIVFKISLSDIALSIPPYTPTLELSEGWAGLRDMVSQLDFENFEFLATDDLYWKSYLSSVQIALLSTFMCLLVGFPIAYGMANAPKEWQPTLMLLVNASSRVYGYQISMNVSGTAESPAVVFSANPPLASESILLMLTAGQLPQDELTFTAQQRATALASYLGKTLIDSWALEEPGEERLSIRSGESISVGGRATYHLEYRLFDRWSLIGEYDEYDAMNAGVKYRLFYR